MLKHAARFGSPDAFRKETVANRGRRIRHGRNITAERDPPERCTPYFQKQRAGGIPDVNIKRSGVFTLRCQPAFSGKRRCERAMHAHRVNRDRREDAPLCIVLQQEKACRKAGVKQCRVDPVGPQVRCKLLGQSKLRADSAVSC